MTTKNPNASLLELFDEAVKFDGNPRDEIQKAYEKDRHRYLAKNQVGLFICGAFAENDRRLPIDAAVRLCIEALRDITANRYGLQGLHEDGASDEEIAKYHADQAFGMQAVAREALAALRAALTGGKP